MLIKIIEWRFRKVKRGMGGWGVRRLAFGGAGAVCGREERVGVSFGGGWGMGGAKVGAAFVLSNQEIRFELTNQNLRRLRSPGNKRTLLR